MCLCVGVYIDTVYTVQNRQNSLNPLSDFLLFVFDTNSKYLCYLESFSPSSSIILKMLQNPMQYDLIH